jgi:2'-5' RNA ligase
MLRLFISVNCDGKVKNQLLSVQDKIKSQSVKGNFSLPENLHLTLVFIGEISADKIPLIASVIDQTLKPRVDPFRLAFSTVGYYTHSKKELWWIGTDHNDMSIEPQPSPKPSVREHRKGSPLEPQPSPKGEGSPLDNLKTIRRRIADGLSSKGVDFDNRPFNPHITLGREIKHASPIIIPKQEIIYPVNRISLMKSERVSGKLTYTEIFGVDL